MDSHSQPTSVAVPVASAKNAKLGALYFDYVVPVFCDDVPREVIPPAFGDWQPTTSVDFLRAIQKRTGAQAVQVPIMDEKGQKMIVRLTDASGNPDVDALEYVNQWVFVNQPEAQSKLRKQMHNARLDAAPVLLTQGFLDRTRQTETLADVSATLVGLPIVNVDAASWQQILDFREDRTSRESLRRLRLHLTRDYIGRTPEQIEAAIELGIEDQSRAAKKHGFELLVGSLQTACASTELLGSAGLGAVAGSMLGTSAGIAIGALVGLSLDLAKMSLTFAKGTRDIVELRKYHPLSYVIEAKARLAG